MTDRNDAPPAVTWRHARVSVHMMIGAKPSADVVIDPALVHALLRAQHPDLADLSLVLVGEGWDNQLYRLGNSLAVRLPRRALAADLIVHGHAEFDVLLAPHRAFVEGRAALHSLFESKCLRERSYGSA
jgi:aminoglycoside phosphotransferase (APT) family kinase protein